ncbi:UDP-N-acetylmuramate dehydrogenase [Fusibacter tunisiensis]|uniref:UDP-N-acetylenolpyruvoylglucosamine reductase n=1 Tax=Fusibacter tunisiensis TaxID=1008308 RepID=A0ABS2MRC6_9FIRM|nr:UDP-N-acetylmuramate dehydrogenase [Fusibacter tunisiensis]MBM7561968.1 UDP-N-acetylmuramate dehydrogenase [Fusibacter tunisiensis]
MIFEVLGGIFSDNQIKKNDPMSNHTSFKIGGPAKAILLPETPDQILKAIEVLKAHDAPYLIMGNGSNILVEDEGIDAFVIKISDQMSSVSIEDTVVVAEAGVLLSTLSKKIQSAALKGFEFASGIPGTLGGAVFMNAGAYDGEMKDVVKWVDVITPEGIIKRIEGKEMQFAYRNSIVREKGYIILRCALEFEYGDPLIIKEITDELTHKRVSRQPLEYPSAGSVFKRPPGFFAGKLIEDAGLRGLRHGDAQVSDKHCGFVVNRGKATFSEVMELIKVVQKVVKDTFDVELEREVRIFGKE